MSTPVIFPSSPDAVAPRAAGTTWTGGQYSLVRALFGAWLFASCVRLLPWDAANFAHAQELRQLTEKLRGSSLLAAVPNLFDWCDAPWLATAVVIVGALASLLFAIGAWHRTAAVVIAYLWICLSVSAPRLPTPGMPWILVLLAGHLTLPPAPFGSWVARGRADPEGAWRIHLPLFQLAWALLLLGSLLGVIDKLATPAWGSGRGSVGWRVLMSVGLVAEAALPICMFWRQPRAIAWSALLLWRLLVLVLGGADDRLRGMVIVHLYSFDPVWLPPLRAKAREHLFFDGTCGLCHRMVRFVAAEDRGAAFFYSPLQGEAIRTLVSDAERAGLPDSVVVRDDAGQLLVRSTAVAHVMRRLGGAWRALGTALLLVPRPLRDFGYDLVARVRRGFFKRPVDACPLLSSRLRNYFLP